MVSRGPSSWVLCWSIKQSQPSEKRSCGSSLIFPPYIYKGVWKMTIWFTHQWRLEVWDMKSIRGVVKERPDRCTWIIYPETSPRLLVSRWRDTLSFLASEDKWRLWLVTISNNYLGTRLIFKVCQILELCRFCALHSHPQNKKQGQWP